MKKSHYIGAQLVLLAQAILIAFLLVAHAGCRSFINVERVVVMEAAPQPSPASLLFPSERSQKGY